jgi:hypothetical protein
MVMLQVHQHWDKLKTCIVGRCYPPEFFSYITNPKIRNVFERIAIETEEDFQSLIALLEKFNVNVLRPDISKNFEDHWDFENKKYYPPPITPRDYMAMIGNKFFFDEINVGHLWTQNNIKPYKKICDFIEENGNTIIKNTGVDSAMFARVGKDLYIGTRTSAQEIWNKIKKPNWPNEVPFDFFEKFVFSKDEFLDKFVTKSKQEKYKNIIQEIFHNKIKDYADYFSDYRLHLVDSAGHLDSCVCIVVPGLIISLPDFQNYEESFPGWEIIYTDKTIMDDPEKFIKFAQVKTKNQGKWWVPGQENNNDFTDFVENYLSHWTGNITETVFDTNILVIDKHNVVCSGYNKDIFSAFERFNITPHIINFRHRFFFDGGIHCMTNDIDREGKQIDYFPGRNQYITETHRNFNKNRFVK